MNRDQFGVGAVVAFGAWTQRNPSIGDRSSPNQWAEAGMPSQVQRASDKVASILATHFPSHIPSAIDEAIRASFPVRLPREAMRPQV